MRPNDYWTTRPAAVEADGVGTECRSGHPTSKRRKLSRSRNPDWNRDFSTTNRWIALNAVSSGPHLKALSIHAPLALLPFGWTARRPRNRCDPGISESVGLVHFGAGSSEVKSEFLARISMNLNGGGLENSAPSRSNDLWCWFPAAAQGAAWSTTINRARTGVNESPVRRTGESLQAEISK